MGREFPTTEDEFELSLELSIGGCYAKLETKGLERETTTPPGGDEGSREVSRSDFSCEKPQFDAAAEKSGEFPDLQRRREMQAIKRKEARMKRDFKKMRGVNGGGGGGEDRVVVVAQQFHGGVERGEREGLPEDEEESARKREKMSNAPLFGENKVTWGDYGPPAVAAAAQFMLPVGNGYACPLVVPMWGSNVAAGEREERNSGEHTPDNVAAAAAVCSSAVSHHRSMSHKGGSSCDTGGSQSSSFGTHQSDKVEHLEVNNSSPHTELGRGIVASSSNNQQQRQSEMSTTVKGSTVRAQTNLTDTCCSTTEKPSLSHTSSVVEKPPKLPTSGQDNGASVLQMPCVSTTGNGPNGRTITGFLHKYTKAEVSIMCVCHGSFFSPAGFVEHAGGINVTHPLRHITVVPPVVR